MTSLTIRPLNPAVARGATPSDSIAWPAFVAPGRLGSPSCSPERNDARPGEDAHTLCQQLVSTGGVCVPCPNGSTKALQAYFDDIAFGIVALTYGIAAVSAAVAVLSSAI